MNLFTLKNLRKKKKSGNLMAPCHEGRAVVSDESNLPRHSDSPPTTRSKHLEKVNSKLARQIPSLQLYMNKAHAAAYSTSSPLTND
jgi:hypothetical protein